MDGWIKINRKITENSMWFSEPFTRAQAWIDLLLITNYHDSYIYIRGNKINVFRGQIAYSREKLAERWQWSRGKVERFLHELENEQCITQQKKRLITLISVINYDKYQGDDTTDGTTDNTSNNATDRKTDNTTDGHILRKDKKEKNNISYIKDILVSDSESETRTAEKPDNFPAQKIVEMWNSTCTKYPKIFTVSQGRRNKMRVRIDEMGGIEKGMTLLQTVFAKMQESSFLRGDSKRGWRASFDWLFSNDKNWVKVYEGNYDNNLSDDTNLQATHALDVKQPKSKIDTMMQTMQEAMEDIK